jgi:hypothetical protein
MRYVKAPVSLLIFVACSLAPAIARAQDSSPVPPPSPCAAIEQDPPEEAALPVPLEPSPQPGRKTWTWSLAPLVASQAFDAASSYGYRELNPLLADLNGGFGAKGVAIKFAVVGALIGAEYLILRKSPRSSRFFAVLNWSGAGVTAGLAVHNYAVH